MAISYLSCINNFDGCAGYGAPKEFTHCDWDSALYFAEGKMGFTQVSDNTITTPINEIIVYVPPNVNEIKFCLTHSDDLNKSVEPTLETYFKIETRKTGSGSLVPPTNPQELESKTNAKILNYRFDQRSMDGFWTFSIRPRPTNNLLSEDRRNTTVRFGCAVLLKRRSNKGSRKSLTQEIIENRKKYS